MKADYFRLAYLYINGGIYIDADDQRADGNPLPTLTLADTRDILLVDPIIRVTIGGRAVGIQPSERPRSLETLAGPECYFNNSPIFASRRNEILRIALIRATNSILGAKRDGVMPDIHVTTGPTNLTLSIVASRLYAACGGAPMPEVRAIDWSRYAMRQQPLQYKMDNRDWRRANYPKDIRPRSVEELPSGHEAGDGSQVAALGRDRC